MEQKLKDMEHTIIEVESNVLSELDTVQEHANNRSERIENRLVCLERNGNSAPDCALALRTEKLEERVEALERKVS
ncbi:hypothetical protein [Mediterraneibacter gnavus]|uniref:hypothetical protein n=1 Tax=Mediterraneibacter gnavus TaxID=33038 RepID=UPI000AA762E0